jgi:hypothetical protein
LFKHAALSALCAVLLLFAPGYSAAQQEGRHSKQILAGPADKPLLWIDPANISTRDLFYGEGGKHDAPPGRTFIYLKEDLSGTSAKIDVRDENGVKWRVKLGEEARPETVATRLLWAAGYFANEEYFLPEIQVQGLQPLSKKRRKRVKDLIDDDGVIHNAELKRLPKSEKKIGTWKWRHNPFSQTRQFNGLRVMMALLNNWDLKDVNNSIYSVEDRRVDGTPDSQGDDPIVYMVSDVGASFGTSGRVRDRNRAKGNLNSYRHSKFIRKVTPEYVDFYTPAREPWTMAVNPKEFIQRIHMRWIGRRIPIADARWMGNVLSKLSREQVRDAFRAADYSPEQADAFTDVVMQRIAQLKNL